MPQIAHTFIILALVPMLEEPLLFVPIANFATPHDFKIPTNKKLYDGTTDPDDHLNTYVNTMNIYAHQMPIWCKVFPATLTDKAEQGQIL